MRKSEAARLLAIIAECWRSFEVTEGKVQIWWEMLADLELSDTLRALKLLITTGSPFPPSIAEIRRAVVEIIAPAEYRIDPLQSWLEARQVAENYFGEEGMEVLSPLTREVVKAFGLSHIREGDSDFIRGQYFKLFALAKERWMKSQMLPAEFKEDLSPPLAAPSSSKVKDDLPQMNIDELQSRRRRFLEEVQALREKMAFSDG